jgi:uncharacterized membrane protein
MTATTDVLTEKPRISSIDVMRGIVMVIMALDHTRDFFNADSFLFDPTDLTKTTPAIFFTRIITHFCAPTFVFLSGVSICISQRRKTTKELSLFLLTRGLWLILLEITVIRFGFTFQLYYDVILFQVIYAIGISMVILSALIFLPRKVIIALGVIITLGHNFLDPIRLSSNDALVIPWSFIYQFNFIPLSSGMALLVLYPFLSWLGIMLLGYGLGSWYAPEFNPEKRKKLLLFTGLGAIVLFIILRYFNIYGDPAPWRPQKNYLFSFMSFINTTKYPVSLLYTLMTLGPVLIVLSLMENLNSKNLKPLLVFGRVPLFYFILHFFIIHISALSLYMITSGKSISEIDFHFPQTLGGLSAGWGYSLAWTYFAWMMVVVATYPLCNWYNKYKSTHKDWWLSYL